MTHFVKNNFLTIPPRQRVRIANAEGRLIVEHYQQRGVLWDIVMNGIDKNPEFEQLPHNLHACHLPYNNNERTHNIRKQYPWMRALGMFACGHVVLRNNNLQKLSSNRLVVNSAWFISLFNL